MTLPEKDLSDAEIPPEIENDPIALLHFFNELNYLWDPRRSRELELHLLAIQVQAIQTLITRLIDLDLLARDLLDIFKSRPSPPPAN